jgi:hypothetical protein
MIMPKGTPKKSRQVPSVERQLALALVALIEDVYAMHNVEADKAMEIPIKIARDVLNANGYSDLKSIRSRVALIQARIAEAVEVNDGASLTQLGPALERAKKGLPPLATEKKPRKKKVEPADTASTTPPAEKKKRGGKKDDKPALPLGEGVPIQCLSCPWEGVGTADSKCPECGDVVALDVTDEGATANA